MTSEKSENTVELRLAGCSWVAVLICWLLGHVTTAPWGGKVFEHGRVVCGQHVFEVRGHGVRPEEVMVESIVTVHTLRWVQHQELIDQIQGIWILNIRLQTLLYLSLLSFG